MVKLEAGTTMAGFIGYVETRLVNNEKEVVYFVTHMGVHPFSSGQASRDISIATLEYSGLY